MFAFQKKYIIFLFGQLAHLYDDILFFSSLSSLYTNSSPFVAFPLLRILQVSCGKNIYMERKNKFIRSTVGSTFAIVAAGKHSAAHSQLDANVAVLCALCVENTLASMSIIIIILYVLCCHSLSPYTL